MPPPVDTSVRNVVMGGVPPHLVDDKTGMVAWMTRPWGLVAQLRRQTHVDRAVADYMMGPVFDTLKDYQGPNDRRALWIADWSTMTGYDSDARTRLTNWAIRQRAEIERIMVVIPEKSRIVRMGIEVAATAVRLVGIEMKVYPSMSMIAHQLDLKAAERRPPAVSRR